MSSKAKKNNRLCPIHIDDSDEDNDPAPTSASDRLAGKMSGIERALALALLTTAEEGKNSEKLKALAGMVGRGHAYHKAQRRARRKKNTQKNGRIASDKKKRLPRGYKGLMPQVRDAAQEAGVDLTIQKHGRMFTIRGAKWTVTAPYKEAALKALDHLGVVPRPDPRLAKEEKDCASKE